jgi:hypothetical protein
VLTDYLVRNRSAGHRDALHVAARSVDGLANRFRNFVCLACCESNFPLAVTDRHKRVEREAASALHDLRDTIDCDDVFDELAAAFAAAFTASAVATALAVTRAALAAVTSTAALTTASTAPLAAATTAATAASATASATTAAATA